MQRDPFASFRQDQPQGFPGAPDRPRVVLDMSPEGEFREPTRWQRLQGRLRGVAMLAALVSAGVLVLASAVVLVGLLLPVMLVVGAVGSLALYWRARSGRPIPGVVFVRR